MGLLTLASRRSTTQLGWNPPSGLRQVAKWERKLPPFLKPQAVALDNERRLIDRYQSMQGDTRIHPKSIAHG